METFLLETFQDIFLSALIEKDQVLVLVGLLF